MTDINIEIIKMSDWIDDHNSHKDPEAQLWSRVAKIGEEFGEVIAALIGITGQNPRKGYTHSLADVRKELMDVIVTAMGAYYHAYQDPNILEALERHVEDLIERAGL